MAQEAPAFNPLHVQWKNPELLAYLGLQKGGVKQGTSVLDESNVMEYFSTSPFYDRHSNNEHVRMQSAALIAQTIATTPQSGAELMATIARKHQEELNPDRVDPATSAYYIINDCIYQAPDMYTILATRLQSSLLGLRTTLDLQREHRVAFNPRRGHFGRFLTADAAPNESDKMEEETS
ncbi:Mediator of RNA polymerase II transcription subunit 6 [Malassezia japonica]|uniref:Mediator of RNA polymerase II transcription subunit 6 n=1 Tax=Malassezia japonica TaxID=223818 RepID=A0AAF0JA05_9BASI|nr:Mediator of RNA polymerase II transcription subunit 6 [Malassezia japonica]WFD39312.1 Mediator of RNA polymerase II transcription subunit 6 [Malassezia japonica]